MALAFGPCEAEGRGSLLTATKEMRLGQDDAGRPDGANYDRLDRIASPGGKGHCVSIQGMVMRELLANSAGFWFWWAAGGSCAKLEEQTKAAFFSGDPKVLRFNAEKKIGVATPKSIQQANHTNAYDNSACMELLSMEPSALAEIYNGRIIVLYFEHI